MGWTEKMKAVHRLPDDEAAILIRRYAKNNAETQFWTSFPCEFSKTIDLFAVCEEIAPRMSMPSDESTDLVKESLLYKEFLAEREEILRHKWIESEKAGSDIGFEKALLDWIVKYRSQWRTQRKESTPQPS